MLSARDRYARDGFLLEFARVMRNGFRGCEDAAARSRFNLGSAREFRTRAAGDVLGERRDNRRYTRQCERQE
jgi:hypothetical protein